MSSWKFMEITDVKRRFTDTMHQSHGVIINSTLCKLDNKTNKAMNLISYRYLASEKLMKQERLSTKRQNYFVSFLQSNRLYKSYEAIIINKFHAKNFLDNL